MGKIEVKCAHDAMVALKKMIPNPKNPNSHPNKQVKALCKIIKSTGWRVPITISRQSGLIVRGHGRFMAAVELECDEVPVDYQDYESEAEELADLVADNQIAELSNFDEDLLGDLMENIKSFEIDLELTGFDDRGLKKLLNKKIIEGGNTDPEYIPDGKNMDVKQGGVYQLGEHRLLCGDATRAHDVKRLMARDFPVLMVTDPPYGVGYDPAWRNEAAAKGHLSYAASSIGQVPFDDRIDWSEAFKLFPGTVVYLWHADRHARDTQRSLEDAGFEIICQIIWAKDVFVISRGDYHRKHEPCWYAVKKGKNHNWQQSRSETTLWNIGRGCTEKTGHGTEKPIECMERPIINNSQRGDFIYDPFGGSGTTIIACERMGRRCLMVEIEAEYCGVIIKRWEDFTGQKAELIG